MKYLNIIGDINEISLEGILENIKELREEELIFIDLMCEDEGISREEVVKNLDPVVVNISTFGGMVDCGFSILDALSQLESPIHTRVNGYCMSTGLLISLVGSHRECGPYANFMYHTIAYGVEGNLGRHKTQIDSAKEIQKKFNSIILEKTNVTEKQLKKYQNEDWYFDAKQALELGFVHKIN